MIPATWTHVDLRTGWPQCTHMGLASNLTALPCLGPRAPKKQVTTRVDQLMTDSCSFCSKKRVLTVGRGELCLQHVSSWLFQNLHVSPLHLISSCFFLKCLPTLQMLLLPANGNLSDTLNSATHCLNEETSDYKIAQWRNFFLFHS